MSNLIKKALKISAYLYGLSLPTAFLVGGAMYARPVKSPMSARALRENLAPEWDTDFLRRSREVKIPVEERVKLTASLFGTDASQTVILLHSSGGNRLEMLPYAYHLWRHNIGVVMLDRRAHGGSEGESQPLFLDETDDPTDEPTAATPPGATCAPGAAPVVRAASLLGANAASGRWGVVLTDEVAGA